MIAAVVFGLLGPLAVAIGSWLVAHRTWRRDPERLTNVMIVSFAGKFLFFGAYVAVMLSVLSLPRIPFVATFTTAFVVLHLAEALALKRLVAPSAAPPSRREAQR